MSADHSTLQGFAREGTGKGPSRRLREKGLIPAVVYGTKLDAPAHLAVSPKAVKAAINTPHKFNTLITIEQEGQPDRQVLLKDYQQHPVSRDLLHVDFLDLQEGQEAKVKVPVVLTGRCIGVKEGGVLNQPRREIEVFALPNAIPEKIEVDVTNLNINENLHLSDLKLPEGVKIKSRANLTIAVVAAPERGEEKGTPAAAAGKEAAPEKK